MDCVPHIDTAPTATATMVMGATERKRGPVLAGFACWSARSAFSSASSLETRISFDEFSSSASRASLRAASALVNCLRTTSAEASSRVTSAVASFSLFETSISSSPRLSLLRRRFQTSSFSLHELLLEGRLALHDRVSE